MINGFNVASQIRSKHSTREILNRSQTTSYHTTSDDMLSSFGFLTRMGSRRHRRRRRWQRTTSSSGSKSQLEQLPADEEINARSQGRRAGDSFSVHPPRTKYKEENLNRHNKVLQEVDQNDGRNHHRLKSNKTIHRRKTIASTTVPPLTHPTSREKREKPIMSFQDVGRQWSPSPPDQPPRLSRTALKQSVLRRSREPEKPISNHRLFPKPPTPAITTRCPVTHRSLMDADSWSDYSEYLQKASTGSSCDELSETLTPDHDSIMEVPKYNRGSTSMFAQLTKEIANFAVRKLDS